ncbi:hypothetical protein C8J56DRAFT_137905 [Mycena floridula]|nr:hypothetical protein C8J56DRAFT_137905 [Mycena floridula]
MCISSEDSFPPLCSFHPQISQPVTMWISQDRADSIWAVFRTHQEACAALSASGPYMTVTTALETDLEPFQKFKRVAPSPQAQVLRLSTSHSELSRGHLEPKTDYTISSNPPNPRNSFRSGDWICNSPNCAAHNFGRNLACIGCGSARSPTYPSPIRAQPSPRFLSTPPLSPMSYNSFPSTPQSPSFPSVQSKGAHPLLTPSGRGFAVGGKVQNISSDPLSPCIMYWPDNEPFPEQGQIRPSNLVGVPQPPILNTGNRGPISHQPGDWVCQKCNYLNWRRRKVCQTCLPYAEGNGDSISAAVQAERIALLTSVLSQTHLSAPSPPQPRSQSMTPPQVQRSFIDVSPPNPRASLVHRSQSHIELGAQYANARPIYQTSGHRHHQSSPLIYTTPTFQQRQNIELHAPAPLLPSFLQDIVQSPTHSPSSTSSADLSFDEYGPYSGRQGREGPSSNNSSSIWRMDGEESKSLSAFPLRLGGSRSNSQERFRD